MGEKSGFWQAAPVDQSRLQFILSFIRLNQTVYQSSDMEKKNSVQRIPVKLSS